MKTPRTPPTIPDLMSQLSADQFSSVITFVSSISPTNKYLHWDKLIRYPPPAGLTHAEWWLGLKLSRNALYKSIPLTDQHGQPFKFLVKPPGDLQPGLGHAQALGLLLGVNGSAETRHGVDDGWHFIPFHLLLPLIFPASGPRSVLAVEQLAQFVEDSIL